MAQMTKDDIKKLVKEAVREVFKENSLITDMMSECIRVSVLTILKEVNTSSISPVGIFGFLLLRSFTVPVACNTNSLPKGFSSSCLFNSSPNNNWVMPYLSRRSINVIAPNFLTVCTQPARVVSVPLFANLNSPQVWVLYIILSFEFCWILLRDDEECDATADASSTVAGYKNQYIPNGAKIR